MNRRQVLQPLVGAAAALLLTGHTPYGQWVVYRKKHLLIGSHRADPETYDLAQRVVALLAEHLPAAKSRVTRARDAGRLASLLGTAQMEVAILSRADSVAMLQGTSGFEPYGKIELRALTPVGGRVLVALAGFPEQHAWLVTGALAGSDLAPLGPLGDPSIPWHPGSLAFQEGRPQPGDG